MTVAHSHALVIRIHRRQSNSFRGVSRTRNGQSATLPEGVWIVQTTSRRESGQLSLRLRFTNANLIQFQTQPSRNCPHSLSARNLSHLWTSVLRAWSACSQEANRNHISKAAAHCATISGPQVRTASELQDAKATPHRHISLRSCMA